MAQEKNVSRKSDQRADKDKINKRNGRWHGDLAWIKTAILSQRDAGQNEQGAAAKHLLAGGQEGRRRIPGPA